MLYSAESRIKWKGFGRKRCELIDILCRCLTRVFRIQAESASVTKQPAQFEKLEFPFLHGWKSSRWLNVLSKVLMVFLSSSTQILGRYLIIGPERWIFPSVQWLIYIRKRTTINDSQLNDADKANNRYSISEKFWVDCSHAHNAQDHSSRTNLP